MKKYLIAFISTMLLVTTVCAQEDNKVYEDTKYFKTIINNSDQDLYENKPFITVEITKEEYDNYDPSSNSDATVETAYKKITSTIAKYGSYYRYTGTLTWKSIPSMRSYDILGIGFNASVKVKSNSMIFHQNYCVTGGSCYTSSTHYPQIFTGGAGATFLLPSGSLTSLSADLHFDVEKNTTATIISQIAATDHAHATSSISLNNAKKYTVNGATGIILNGISSYYDAINPAVAHWSGIW